MKLIESSHPYVSGNDAYWTVSFEDDKIREVEIAFDPCCHTCSPRDYVQIFTDESLLNYEPPAEADLVLKTDSMGPADCVAKIIELLDQKDILS